MRHAGSVLAAKNGTPLLPTRDRRVDVEGHCTITWAQYHLMVVGGA